MYTLCILMCITPTIYMYMCVVGSSPTRGSSFFLGKVTALGVLCCFALFVCLTLLASFFLPSHLSFKNMYTITIPVCSCCYVVDTEGLIPGASHQPVAVVREGTAAYGIRVPTAHRG